MDQALTDTLKRILGSRAVGVLTQIAVGLGLLYAIDKFFKLVEEKLSDQTKLEVARWLRLKNFESGIVADETVN